MKGFGVGAVLLGRKESVFIMYTGTEIKQNLDVVVV